MIRIQPYSLSDFCERYLPAQRPARGIRATVLHHTWKPTASDYRGTATIEAIRDYHVKSNGWRDIGANAYAAPDGQVYNARPLADSNYCHAHISRPWEQVPADLRALAAGNRQFLNYYGFGIETIGDFDTEPIEPLPPALDTALWVLAAVHRRYALGPERLFLHRDAAAKSCPGNRISRTWARQQLARRMDGAPADATSRTLQVITLPGGEPLQCRAALENGVTRCDLRPLAQALGAEVIADALADQGIVYLRRKQ